ARLGAGRTLVGFDGRTWDCRTIVEPAVLGTIGSSVVMANSRDIEFAWQIRSVPNLEDKFGGASGGHIFEPKKTTDLARGERWFIRQLYVT
ncbi:MAG: hypothetical protein AAF511_12250, partial [Pseudomonadota bacterium]